MKKEKDKETTEGAMDEHLESTTRKEEIRRRKDIMSKYVAQLILICWDLDTLAKSVRKQAIAIEKQLVLLEDDIPDFLQLTYNPVVSQFRSLIKKGKATTKKKNLEPEDLET